MIADTSSWKILWIVCFTIRISYFQLKLFRQILHIILRQIPWIKIVSYFLIFPTRFTTYNIFRRLMEIKCKMVFCIINDQRQIRIFLFIGLINIHQMYVLRIKMIRPPQFLLNFTFLRRK